jgi:hypothetical protein
VHTRTKLGATALQVGVQAGAQHGMTGPQTGQTGAQAGQTGPLTGPAAAILPAPAVLTADVIDVVAMVSSHFGGVANRREDVYHDYLRC